MKNKAHLMAIMAMALGGDFMPSIYDERKILTDEQLEIKRKKNKERYKYILIKKGVRLFNIDGIEVIAINEKNAIRKANKIKDENNC